MPAWRACSRMSARSSSATWPSAAAADTASRTTRATSGGTTSPGGLDATGSGVLVGGDGGVRSTAVPGNGAEGYGPAAAVPAAAVPGADAGPRRLS